MKSPKNMNSAPRIYPERVEKITLANISVGFADETGKTGYVPAGPLYLTSVLEKHGIEVDFRDYLTQSSRFANPLDPAGVCDFLADAAGVVGVSCTSGTLPLVILAVEQLKQRHPEKLIILGGIGPTGAAEPLLHHFPFIDIVCKGEGEQTFMELLDRPAAGLENIKGISYRDETGVHANPPRERIQNLDALPFPAYHKVNLDDYFLAGIVASRGCPYKCAFCDVSPFWGYRYRARGIANIIEEIKLVRRTYGQRHILFYDEIFVINRQWVLELCDRLEKEHLDVEWLCLARIDLMDETLMERMAGSGCRMVFYGIESGADPVLDHIGKGFNRKQALDIIRTSLTYFDVTPFFMWGYPHETWDQFIQTIDLVKAVSGMGATPLLYSLCPLPLTQLREKYREKLRFSGSWCRRLTGENTPREIIDIIGKYPDVFPGFYYYHTEDFHKKYELAGEFSRHDPFLTPRFHNT
jgi:radical SAM superfamily enzyme YgiQ (UPF0313 family)